jgi:excisionase family DNA binding protein
MKRKVNRTMIDYRDPEWVSEKLGIDKNNVYKYLQEGVIPAVQLGRKWLISEKQLEEWLERQTAEQTRVRREAALSVDRTLAGMDNYSSHALRVIRAAHQEARACCHSAIGVMHLLVAMACESECSAAKAMARLGLTPEKLRGELEATQPHGQVAPPKRLARDAHAKQAMHLAATSARSMSKPLIGTEDLLMGVVQVEGQDGLGILPRLGLKAEHVRQALEGPDVHGLAADRTE